MTQQDNADAIVRFIEFLETSSNGLVFVAGVAVGAGVVIWRLQLQPSGMAQAELIEAMRELREERSRMAPADMLTVLAAARQMNLLDVQQQTALTAQSQDDAQARIARIEGQIALLIEYLNTREETA